MEAEGLDGAALERQLEDRDEYTAESVFWVPFDARWANIQNQAKRPEIGKLIDDVMYAIERDNPKLKGKLPRDYARRGIPPERLGGLIDLIAGIALGSEQARAKDVLGRVYEYFLGKFAAAEGKLGGEFFTPQRVVRLLVEMIEPFDGRVYDPCCGSGGMFVQSERFAEAHAAGRQRQLRLDFAFHPSPGPRPTVAAAAWPASSWPTARSHRARPARATYAGRSSRPM